MLEDIKHIHSYYSPNDLYNKIIDGLNKLGKDLPNVTLDDLQPVDEFAVGQIVEPGSSIYSGNPELSEIPFTRSAIPVRIHQGFVNGICRGAK